MSDEKPFVPVAAFDVSDEAITPSQVRTLHRKVDDVEDLLRHRVLAELVMHRRAMEDMREEVVALTKAVNRIADRQDAVELETAHVRPRRESNGAGG
jgi:hypothetical protein